MTTADEGERKLFRKRVKTVMTGLTHYTENSTIHGIKYLGERRRPVGEKCFWIIIFVFCISIFGFFIYDLILKWQQKAVILIDDLEPTPIFDIPFPAVTICPQFKIKPKDFDYTKFDEMIKTIPVNDPEYFMKFELAQQLCAYENVNMLRHRYSSKFNLTHLTLSHIHLMLQITPQMSDVMNFARFQNEFMVKNDDVETNTLFSPILTTGGVCFTFNLPSEIIRSENLQTDYAYYNIGHTIKGWDYETGYSQFPSFPRISWATGVPNSLKCKMIAPRADLYTQCQPTNLGYKIVLHSPAAYPSTFQKFIPLHHDTMAKIQVTPKIITTSPQLRSFTPQQRQCYFNDERHLQFYKFYNRPNCRLECFANFTIAKYNCVHFSFPRNSTTKICGSNLDYLLLRVSGENTKSFQDFTKKFPNEANKSAGNPDLQFYCDCLPVCNSIEYEFVIKEDTFYHETVDNSSTVPVLIDIFWSETSITGYTRKQLYSFVDLISNFGGLLGLFVGASILSIFEILYFCVIRQFSKCVKTRNVESPTNSNVLYS